MLRGCKELQTKRTNPIKQESQNAFHQIPLHRGYHVHMWVYDSQTPTGQHPLVFSLLLFSLLQLFVQLDSGLQCGTCLVKRFFSSNCISTRRTSWSNSVYHLITAVFVSKWCKQWEIPNELWNYSPKDSSRFLSIKLSRSTVSDMYIHTLIRKKYFLPCPLQKSNLLLEKICCTV